jgi:hypothetical protein
MVGMAKPRLNGTRVMPGIRQRIPAAVPQHVRMDRDGRPARNSATIPFACSTTASQRASSCPQAGLSGFFSMRYLTRLR